MISRSSAKIRISRPPTARAAKRRPEGAGAPLPSGLKFAGLCAGGALILLFAIERLLTGDYRAPDAPAKAED